MQIELKKPSEIKPYFNNPRKNDDAVIKVAESIQSFGFQNPIIVDKNLTIIAGHTREIDRQTKNDIHPTIRPLVLWSQLLQHHTQKGNIVYDPFLGSGTTILACEKHNRNGYGLEISPNFCDVTIERWEQFTGGKAELING